MEAELPVQDTNQNEVAPNHINGSKILESDRKPSDIHGKLRGGGCILSTLCDLNAGHETESQQHKPSPTIDVEPTQHQINSTRDQEDSQIVHTSWPGWAELENDPDIFTIILQDWGMQGVQVNEVYDLSGLSEATSSSVFGLIFLSRYAAPDQTQKSTSLSPNVPTKKPWFANQISKFSCGTVALMNILMNVQSSEVSLSEALTDFKASAESLNSKHKGIALDNHAEFRDIHNSFSTLLDRYIVDVMLKEEVSKAKREAQAQSRTATKKRKRGAGGYSTKRRTRKQAEDEDEENGFHFVAYVSAHGSVWKLDGMQAAPCHVGRIEEGQTWLVVAVEDISVLLTEALNSGQECTMMSVTKAEETRVISTEERARKQQDWAPFIETLIRIHAERGDLNEMLQL